MIAIHCASGSFPSGWIKYCKEHQIPYKEVNCFADDIIAQLQGCTMLMWHWEHHDYRASLFARQLIASAEAMGVRVFPDTNTCWHYDDKVGQKYLLEAIGAPLVPSHVFYHRDAAMAWLEQATFPLVWKLRGGASSQNVRLVHDHTAARKIIRRSFAAGWRPDRLHALRERLWQFRKAPSLRSFTDIGRGLLRTVVPHEKHRNQLLERNYVYFQEFIPGLTYDIRVVVIGSRCYAFRRMTRDGDFRASGSGSMDHNPEKISLSIIATAFEVAGKMRAQSVAFDFVQTESEALIIEVSYAFALKGYRNCPGWWDRDLTWHEGHVRPEAFMIQDLLAVSDGPPAVKEPMMVVKD